MKKGEHLKCPHCGEATIAKAKAKLDGWKTVGEVLVCALCRREIGVPEADAPAAADSRKSNAFAALLQTEAEAKPVIAAGAGAFCHACRHFIVHPFQSRCGVTGRDADPMGDCAKFERKEP